MKRTPEVTISAFKHAVQGIQKQQQQPQTLLSRVSNLWQNNSEHSKQIRFQRILFILKSYAQTRSLDQLDAVRNYLESNFEYIAKFKEKLDRENQLELFREMTTETFTENQTIFRSGDSGRKMYFILSGSVAILLPTSVYAEEQSGEGTFEQLMKTRYAQYQWIASKGEGEVFGEIAIEQRTTRTATVIAKQDTVTAIITYDTYQRILAAYQTQITNQRLAFLSSIPIFKDWHRQHQLVLLNSLEFFTLRSGQEVYRRSQIDSYVYLVIQGEVEVYNYVHKNSEAQKNCIPQVFYQQSVMAIISVGQFFGDHEHFNNLTKRVTTAKVRSPGQAYKIPYSRLLEYFKMYSSIEEFQDYQRAHCQIQMGFKSKTVTKEEESNQNLDFEQISQSYFQKQAIDKKIETLRRQQQRNRNSYNVAAEIIKLEESKNTLEIQFSQKYAMFIPFRENPYLNEGKVIKSRKTHRITLSTNRDTKCTSLTTNQFMTEQQGFTPTHCKTASQIAYPKQRSLAQIIQKRIQSLDLRMDQFHIQSGQLSSTSKKKTEHSIHNCGINDQKAKKLKISASTLYKFQKQGI